MSQTADDNATLQAAREAYLAARRGDAAKRKAKRETAGQGDTSRHSAKAGRSKAVRNASAMASAGQDAKSARANGAALRRDERADYATSPPESLLGRPRVWTNDLADQWKTAALVWLSQGKSLSAFVRTYPNGPCRWQFLKWLDDDPIFASNYVRARAAGADAMADRIIDAAENVQDAGREDSARVNAARLMVDSLKWTASKLKPGAYADRLEHGGTVQHDHTGQVLTDDARAMALAAFMTRQTIAAAASLPDAMARLQTAAPPVLELTASQPETADDLAPSAKGLQTKDK